MDNTQVNNIQFYFTNQVVSWLYNRNESDDDAPKFRSGDEFSFDMIDQPFHCEVQAEEDSSSLFGYIRSEFGTYEKENANLTITIYNNGDEPSVNVGGGLGGDPVSVGMHFLKVGAELRSIILEKSLMQDYQEMDLDKEGVLVKLVDDDLVFERVSGKKRPSMLCTSFFGGTQMMRPYPDEMVDSWLNESMSFEENLEAAESGDDEAMGRVGLAYLNGDDVEQDEEKAVYWFQRQAELENSTGQYNLAIQYLKGQGIEQNFEQALYWMKKAEENGDMDAPGFVQTFENLVALQTKVKEGDGKAKVEFANALMSLGVNVGDSSSDSFFERSVKLAEEAIGEKEASAYWTLALAYEHGRGVEENIEKAIELYQTGADLGDASCQQNLGAIYITGEYVPADYEKGFELSLKAAEQGNGNAMKVVGICYQFGYGVEDNMKKAIHWYEKALEVIDDPELERKVFVFKQLEDIDEEIDKETDNSDANLPDGYMEAMDMFMMADEISGSTPQQGEMVSSEGTFDIVIEKAESGDADAKFTAGKYFIADHVEEETERAIRWIREAAEAGVEEAETYMDEHRELFE